MTSTLPKVANERPASSLDFPVTRVPGIGAESAKLLERMNIHTIGDLLWHLPTRFDDFSKFVPLRRLVANATQTAIATLGRISQRRTATGKLMTEAELAEEDGTPTDVRATWFGRAFVKETHREGERVRVSGKVRFFGRALQFSQPTLERADAEAVHTGRLVPVYPLTEGIKPGQMRRWLHTAIEGGPRRTGLVSEVPEPLPGAIRERHGLPDIASALRQVHFPDDVERLFAARRRLAFDELLVLQLALAQRRARWTAQASALPLRAGDEEVSRWIGELPFALTGAQRRSLDEIRADLARRVPMSRRASRRPRMRRPRLWHRPSFSPSSTRGRSRRSSPTAARRTPCLLRASPATAGARSWPASPTVRSTSPSAPTRSSRSASRSKDSGWRSSTSSTASASGSGPRFERKGRAPTRTFC
ncbi:MAG: hypothetical protein E6J13_02560 [Chloroflexi bacterium]|nr:MAG: hypothetical protein E6J13_02560 [Chloroflexota bacterium]